MWKVGQIKSPSTTAFYRDSLRPCECRPRGRGVVMCSSGYEDSRVSALPYGCAVRAIVLGAYLVDGTLVPSARRGHEWFRGEFIGCKSEYRVLRRIWRINGRAARDSRNSCPRRGLGTVTAVRRTMRALYTRATLRTLANTSGYRAFRTRHASGARIVRHESGNKKQRRKLIRSIRII